MLEVSMSIDSIGKETNFSIEILLENYTAGKKLSGVLQETVDDVYLFIRSKDLHAICAAQENAFNMLITFSLGNNKFSFYCRTVAALVADGVELTKVVAITGVKKEGRRASPRFLSSAIISLYREGKGSSPAPLCVGQADDISYDAICMLTDYDIDMQTDLNSKFTVEFTLFGKHFFRFTAKLLNSRYAPSYTRYKNGYVFLFDFAGWPDERARLVNVILEDRIKALDM